MKMNIYITTIIFVKTFNKKEDTRDQNQTSNRETRRR